MSRCRIPSNIVIAVAMGSILAAGCEGVLTRKHDISLDISPPTDEQLAVAAGEAEPIDVPAMVESMMRTRSDHIQALVDMEASYLRVGDSVRANWARRQRQLVSAVEVYPYLTDEPNEQRVEVSPDESIREADEKYARAVALMDEVSLIPAAGALQAVQQKSREALRLFKSILRDHPRSDKVDDCAFYCGLIYKEYLREDDPDNELCVRYYRWAIALDPQTPHPARFHCAVVLDYRRHERDKALELYHQVLDDRNDSNARWAATRIEQLTDEQFSHERPRDRALPSSPRMAGDSILRPSGPVAGRSSDTGTEPDLRNPGP